MLLIVLVMLKDDVNEFFTFGKDFFVHVTLT